jgi:hypothetical protein
MKYWLVALRQTLCLRGKSKVISVPKVRSLCSEAAETKPMNRLPFDTITAKSTVSLSFLRKMLVNEAMFLCQILNFREITVWYKCSYFWSKK